jgi:colicin import membrane protein
MESAERYSHLQMPRKLKTYQTSQGFYDLAVATPSMKAALEAWGSKQNLFHQGFAKETDDGKVVAAAMAKPGIVLRRPVGSDQPFREHADLPTVESLDSRPRKSKAPSSQRTSKAAETDEKGALQAAHAYERERERRERQRQKEETAAAKARARRHAAVSNAEAALESARREHEATAAKIEKDRAAIEQRAQVEEARWDKMRERLEAALHKAKGVAHSRRAFYS